jgi:arylformamidase
LLKPNHKPAFEVQRRITSKAMFMTTPEFFDREYNARATIPNAQEIFADWRARAEQARSELPGLKNLTYGSSEEETLDLFWCLKPDRPLFVFIHGGYWRSLHKNDFSWVAEPYLKQGINVAIVNYDLVPRINLSTQVSQVYRSIAWLYDNAEALDFDREKIFVGGHSAGGHLTAMMLCTQWPKLRSDLPVNLVKGGIALSGLFDLDPISKAPFLNVDLKLSAEDVRKLSPVLMPPSHPANLLLSVGALESSEFHRQSDMLEKAWQGKILMSRIPAPDRNHLTVCDALADPSHAIFKANIALMDQ